MKCLFLFLCFFNLAISDEVSAHNDHVSEEVALERRDREQVLTIISTFKTSGNYFINPDFSKLHLVDYDPANKADEEAKFSDLSESVEKFNQNSFKLFDTKFKFHLYDDIRFDIVSKFAYNFNHGEAAVDKMKRGDTVRKLQRVITADVGFWFDWNALDYLKIGLRGGDETDGYAFKLKNRGFIDQDEASRGWDVSQWSFTVFNQFVFKPTSWMKVSPELRFNFAKGKILPANSESGATIFSLALLMPTCLEFKPWDELKLTVKLNPKMTKDFLSEKYAAAVKYKGTGYQMLIKASLGLEYKVLNVVTLSLPLKSEVSGEYFANENKDSSSTKITLETVPSISVDYELFNNLYLVGNVDFKYPFLTVCVGDKNTVDWLTSPTIAWGIGFKYDSTY